RQTVTIAAPHQTCAARAVEVPGCDDSPALVERIVRDDPAANACIPIQELNFGEAIALAPPHDVASSVMIEVTDGGNRPSAVKRVVGDEAAANPHVGVQQLDLRKPVRITGPQQIAATVPVKIRDPGDRPASIEGTINDRAAAGVRGSIQELNFGKPVAGAPP